MRQSPKTIGSAFMEYMKPKGIETVNSVITELSLISDTVKTLKLNSFFKNPSFTSINKEEWLKNISNSLNLSLDAQNLIITLLKIDQLGAISKVVSAMKELRLHMFSVGEGHVTTATPLTDEQRETVTALVKKIGNFKEAIIIENTNPNLLGGIAVSAGDMLLDATIKRQLKNILKLVS